MASKPADRLDPPDSKLTGLAMSADGGDFRQLIDVAPDGIIVYQDDRIVYANAKGLAQFGATRLDELNGHGIFEFVAPNDRASMQAYRHHLLSTGEAPSCKRFRRRQLDGAMIEVETSANRITWCGRHALLGIVRTVVREGELDRLLEDNEKRLMGFLSTATNWLWETDAEHRFTMLSDEINDSGFKQPDVLGKTRWELAGASPETSDHWASHRADLDARRPFRDFEYRNTGPEGDIRYGSVSGVPVFNEDGVFKGYRGTSKNITERKQAELALEHLALHDPLTDLFNRRHFETFLSRCCTDAENSKGHFSVLFLDLDHFKDINDIFGHHAGDQLLIEMAARLEGCIGPADLIARISGDEFAIIHTALAGDDSTVALARRLEDAIEQPYCTGGQWVRLRASIGIASYPADAREPSALMQNADMALYQAKRGSGHCWEFFQEAVGGDVRRRCTLEHDLRGALARQKLTMVYQPLIDLESDEVVGVESLVRWEHPSLGPISPDSFIPIAEATGLILPMGLWILRTVCQQTRLWRSAHPDFRVAINLSNSQLRHATFSQDLERILAELEIEPQSIDLELTESMLIETQHRQTTKTLQRLADLGVRMSIDDFGTGYSSLSYLSRLPVGRIKIDQAFVGKIGGCRDDEGIIRAVIALGHNLGMSITAEGVETEEQAAFLKAENCDEAQGFYMGRPQAADVIGKLLTTTACPTMSAPASL